MFASNDMTDFGTAASAAKGPSFGLSPDGYEMAIIKHIFDSGGQISGLGDIVRFLVTDGFEGTVFRSQEGPITKFCDGRGTSV